MRRALNLDGTKPQLINLSDESLLELIQAGEHPAFNVLVNRHLEKFYSLAYRTVSNKNNAEDIVQEAFLKLWKDPKKWNPSKATKFTTWFYRVVSNLAIDFNRKKQAYQIEENFDVPAPSNDLDRKLDRAKDQAMIDRWVHDLPERQQEALNLCFYEGISITEASEIMQTTYKAVESLLLRAKTKLKERYKEVKVTA